MSGTQVESQAAMTAPPAAVPVPEQSTPPAVAAAAPSPMKKGRRPAAAGGAGGRRKPAAKGKAGSSSHPSTSQMVRAAIGALNERGGSSLQAIKKYVGANNVVDAERMATHIRK